MEVFIYSQRSIEDVETPFPMLVVVRIADFGFDKGGVYDIHLCDLQE